MKIIPVKIPNRKASVPCLVDDMDFVWLTRHRWHLVEGYAATTMCVNKKARTFLMHRMIERAKQIRLMKLESFNNKQMVVDHKDHDLLNNQRNNLRLCSPTENRRNSVVKKNSFVGIKGLTPGKNGGYVAQIKIGPKIKYLGTFPTKEKAKQIYQSKAKEIHGEFYHDAN